MATSDEQCYIGQMIFFQMVERSPNNRGPLARFALSLCGDDEAHSIRLSNFLDRLDWDEYQTMLSMLALHAHVAIRWDEDQKMRIHAWALE